MHFMTTENTAYHGPAASHLTVYIEPVNGKLRLAATDIQNKDSPHGLTQGPLKGGYNGQLYDSQEVLFKVSGLESWRDRWRDGFPVDARSFSPEVLQVIQLAGVGREEVNDQVAVVLQQPLARFFSLISDPLRATVLEHLVDFLCHGLHLPGAGACRQDEVIDDGSHSRKVEDQRILPASVLKNTSGQTRLLQTGFKL